MFGKDRRSKDETYRLIHERASTETEIALRDLFVDMANEDDRAKRHAMASSWAEVQQKYTDARRTYEDHIYNTRPKVSFRKGFCIGEIVGGGCALLGIIAGGIMKHKKK